MIFRMAAWTGLILGALNLVPASATPIEGDGKPEDQARIRKALGEVQDFIGLWNLEGTQKADGKVERWKEQVSWGWKFKDGDPYLTVNFGDTKSKGKYFTAGTLKYDLKKGKYILALIDSDKAEQVFTGAVARGILKVDRKDPKSGDVYRVTMNTLTDGIRFQMKYDRQEGGLGIYSAVYGMIGNKDGESIVRGAKKPECIVSGGAATISVSYMGKTYYCCCSGCRDEFNANPGKYVKAK